MIETLVGTRETVHHKTDTHVRLYVNDECEHYPPHWHNDMEILFPLSGSYTAICPNDTYVLRPGDTVFDILDRAVRYNRIQMEYQGARENSFGSVYIQGLHYLYEFSCGPLSGWMYRVNGEFPNKGCSDYELNDGDVIEFLFNV